MRTPVLAALALALAACGTRQSATKDTTAPAAATTTRMPNDSARAAALRSELDAVEKSWSDATIKKDTAALGRLLADEFVTLLPNGDSVPKQTVLHDMAADKDTTLGVRSEKVRVQSLGDSLALVSGVAVWTMPGKGAKPVEMRANYLELFTRRAGRWQALVGHYTPLPASSPAKRS
jgi:ketosteroid isomerase-like protein